MCSNASLLREGYLIVLRRNLFNEQRKRICEEHEATRMSQNELATWTQDTFKVSVFQSTINNTLKTKEKTKLMNMDRSDLKAKKVQRASIPVIDQALYQLRLQCQS